MDVVGEDITTPKQATAARDTARPDGAVAVLRAQYEELAIETGDALGAEVDCADDETIQKPFSSGGRPGSTGPCSSHHAGASGCPSVMEGPLSCRPRCARKHGALHDPYQNRYMAYAIPRPTLRSPSVGTPTALCPGRSSQAWAAQGQPDPVPPPDHFADRSVRAA